MERHRILGGKVILHRRVEGGNWHCYAFLQGQEWRKTTKEKNLARAKDFATDWYAQLSARLYGNNNPGKMFAQAARAFLVEYEASQEQQNPSAVQAHKDRLRRQLLPYFDNTFLSEINSGAVQQYRVHRLTDPEHDTQSARAPVGRGGANGWKPPGRKTIENEIATLRMVLETAQRHGWIDRIPDLSDPYEPKGATEPRPSFTPWEYRRLCDATRRNADHLHDYVVFMVNTGLKPSEAEAISYGDVEIVRDDDAGERILEIVIGDSGDTCLSTPAAVCAFEQMIARNSPQPADRLFPATIRKQFSDFLARSNLKHDRAGKARTPYSLRHSYICFRLLEGAGFDELALNCRTSVETIEQHYAAHLQDLVGALLDDLRSEHRSAPQILRHEDDSGIRPEI